ncbi:MAG: DUF1826 domain-containing protein [Sphingomonadales bacterium]|nr:DUF1826 domain-containing protein [Sphingomonadales bacterium]
MSPIWRAGRAPERIAVVVTQCRYWRTTVAAMAEVLFASPRRDRLRSAVRDGYDGGILGTIKSQAVSAAVWRRPIPRRLARWLALHTPSQLLEAGIVVRPKFLLDELSQAAAASGLSESCERERFLTDVAGLASAWRASSERRVSTFVWR